MNLYKCTCLFLWFASLWWEPITKNQRYHCRGKYFDGSECCSGCCQEKRTGYCCVWENVIYWDWNIWGNVIGIAIFENRWSVGIAIFEEMWWILQYLRKCDRDCNIWENEKIQQNNTQVLLGSIMTQYFRDLNCASDLAARLLCIFDSEFEIIKEL